MFVVEVVAGLLGWVGGAALPTPLDMLGDDACSLALSLYVGRARSRMESARVPREGSGDGAWIRAFRLWAGRATSCFSLSSRC